MSERGNFRGGRGGGGRGRGGGGGPPSRGGGGSAPAEPRKKENILDLSKYLDKQITVKFSGGREVNGLLKGYDQLMNLTLDDVKEVTKGERALRDVKIAHANIEQIKMGT